MYLNSLYCYQMTGEKDTVVLVSMLQIMLFWWLEIPWCVIFSCCFELLWSFPKKKKIKSPTPVPHCWRNDIADEKKCTWVGNNCQNQHLAVQNKVCTAEFCEHVYVPICTHIHTHNEVSVIHLQDDNATQIFQKHCHEGIRHIII